MDPSQRTECSQIRALIIKGYGSNGPEYQELDAVLGGLEGELAAAHAAAVRKDAEIAALKAERDLYLATLARLERRITEVVGEEIRDVALHKVSSDVREGTSFLVPAPVHANGAMPHTGGTAQ